MDPAWTRLTRTPRWKDPNAHGASTRAVDPWNSAGTWSNGRLSVDNAPAMAMAQWRNGTNRWQNGCQTMSNS